MAYLDWIKDRSATRKESAVKSSQEQKTPTRPQTAREMYAARDAQEQANQKPIPPEVKAQADRALASINKGSGQLHTPEAPVAADSSANAAQLQQQKGQERVQAALSPTDQVAGKTALQGRDQTQEKPAQNPGPTMPRRAPSWER